MYISAGESISFYGDEVWPLSVELGTSQLSLLKLSSSKWENMERINQKDY
jgi:hypothetical protein